MLFVLFRLILLAPDMIRKLHQSNFKSFALTGLTLEEIRAVRAALPEFTSDQRIKNDFAAVC